MLVIRIEGWAIGQVLHGSAATTEAVRRAIQHSQEPEGSGQALRHQPEDGSEVEETIVLRRSANGPKGAEINRTLAMSAHLARATEPVARWRCDHFTTEETATYGEGGRPSSRSTRGRQGDRQRSGLIRVSWCLVVAASNRDLPSGKLACAWHCLRLGARRCRRGKTRR